MHPAEVGTPAGSPASDHGSHSLGLGTLTSPHLLHLTLVAQASQLQPRQPAAKQVNIGALPVQLVRSTVLEGYFRC